MILLENNLHILATYLNRWGGPRYKIIKLQNFIDRYLLDDQKTKLFKKQNINTILISEAVLTSSHKPLYLKTIKASEKKQTVYRIKDELGFTIELPEETELLMWNNSPEYVKAKHIKTGMERVINFEILPEFHSDFNSHFLSVLSSDVQSILCNGINSNVLLRKLNNNTAIKKDELNRRKNSQEIYLVKIEEVAKLDTRDCFELEFLPFSYVFKKDKNSNKTKYYNKINKLRAKKYIDKMRNKVFNIKKDKYKIEMEIVNAKSNH